MPPKAHNRKTRDGVNHPRGRMTRLPAHQTRWLSGLLPYYGAEIRGNRGAANKFYTKTTKMFLTVFRDWKPPVKQLGK